MTCLTDVCCGTFELLWGTRRIVAFFGSDGEVYRDKRSICTNKEGNRKISIGLFVVNGMRQNINSK